MSGRTAKAARRTERAELVERIMQAHDALHRDDPAEAHGQLHAALGVEERELAVEKLGSGERFDRAFRQLCATHGVAASYVAIGSVDDTGVARLTSGGDAEICAAVDTAFRLWRESIAALGDRNKGGR
jgi:hypothetical protein